ncbi:MAG: hypothetical protein JW709_11220 [Sedimentisphaerales bacterium]|nr:hypothetical protein [Sedimentisphaerales bacterium]
MGKRIGIYLGYLICATLPVTVGVHRPGITGWKPALYEDLIYMRASRPYVKRQLIPFLVRTITRITPQGIKDALKKRFGQSTWAQKHGWPADYATEYVVGLVIMIACLAGGLAALYHFLRLFLEITPLQAHGAALGTGLLLPLSLSGKMYYYDWGVLLLFTWAMVLMYQQRWRWYYPVFILACLNKETTILLPAIMAVWLGRKALRRSFVYHILAQVVLCGGICLAIAWWLRDRPGGNTEWHLQRNLGMNLSRLAYVRLVIMAMGIILAIKGLRGAPVFIYRGYLLILCVLLTTMLFIGYIDELRDMYEILPFTIVLILIAVGRRWGIQPRRETISAATNQAM